MPLTGLGSSLCIAIGSYSLGSRWVPSPALLHLHQGTVTEIHSRSAVVFTSRCAHSVLTVEWRRCSQTSCIGFIASEVHESFSLWLMSLTCYRTACIIHRRRTRTRRTGTRRRRRGETETERQRQRETGRDRDRETHKLQGNVSPPCYSSKLKHRSAFPRQSSRRQQA